MRDTYFQKRCAISEELSATQRLAELHEMRLDHTDKTLSVIEDLIGETRARFRARGISTVNPQYLPPYSTSESTAVGSGSIAGLSGDPIALRTDGVDPEVSAHTPNAVSRPPNSPHFHLFAIGITSWRTNGGII